MKTESLADLEITILEPAEQADLTEKLRGCQIRWFRQVLSQHPATNRHETVGHYAIIERFSEIYLDLKLPDMEQFVQKLTQWLEEMSPADPAYYEPALKQSKLNFAVGEEVLDALKSRKESGEKLTREEIDAARGYFQMARRYGEKALSLYKTFSLNWPEWKRGYETYCGQTIAAAVTQEVMAIIQLPQEPQADLAEYTRRNTALAHRLYNNLFAQGVFQTQEEGLITLLGYAYALTIEYNKGASPTEFQADWHRARGYLQTVKTEFVNRGLGTHPITIGIDQVLSALDEYLTGVVC